MKLDFTSRSTKRVFVICQGFEISRNSKGGQVPKLKGHKNFITGLPVAQPNNQLSSVFRSGTNRTLVCSVRAQDISVCVESLE